jgi:hypothetical protein
MEAKKSWKGATSLKGFQDLFPFSKFPNSKETLILKPYLIIAVEIKESVIE